MSIYLTITFITKNYLSRSEQVLFHSLYWTDLTQYYLVSLHGTLRTNIDCTLKSVNLKWLTWILKWNLRLQILSFVVGYRTCVLLILEYAPAICIKCFYHLTMFIYSVRIKMTLHYMLYSAQEITSLQRKPFNPLLLVQIA